jgi:hypothetical protein
MKKISGLRAITLVMAALLAACGGGGGGDEDATCEEFDPWETGDDGADVSAPPPAGEARAGRIEDEADVPHGLKNFSQVGDFMMRNGKVLFVIEDEEPFHGYMPFAGGIVHADLVGDDGEPLGRNNFGESFHGLSIKLLDPTSISVISDGSDGGEAVIRVVGPMSNMPLLDVAFSFLFETNHGASYVLDYVLGPASEFLEIRFHIRNPNPSWAYVNLFIFGAIMGDGLALFTPEGGFDRDELSGNHALYGHVGEQISYGWMDAEGGSLQYVMEESQIMVGDKGRTLGVEACTEVTVPVIRLVVSGGGAEALLAAARRVEGTPEPDPTTFTPSVEGGGEPAGARVHVTDTDGAYVTTVTADEAGAWSAGLEDGDYLATAVLDGHPVTRDVAFTAPGTVDLTIAQAATVTYTVEDGEGAAVPAKIMFFPDVSPDALPAAFGETDWPGAAASYVFDPWSAGSLLLPPGDYTVVASRGYEYEIDEQAFTATAGEETVLDLVIEHSVDSTGMLCGDFHVHSMHSPDSSDPRGEKVCASAGEGVEILVSTDHEWVADYQPDIEAEGLQAWVRGVAGEELTTYDYGHFNVYPQTVREDRANNGAIDWYYRDPTDVFGEVHTDPLDPVLQINHPRSGTSLNGYFVAVGFDPDENTFSHPELWCPDFEALEVWNGESFAEQEEGTDKDWFALVDMGLRFAAMGNSDTHHYVNTEIGYPRSCLVVGHDDPEALTNAVIRDTVKAMQVTVSGGILVTAEGPAAETYGEIVDAPSGTADFHVVVQAPTWIDVQRLRVFVSGVEMDPITLDATTAVRWDDTIVVATDDGGDGWVVFVAEGDAAMDPVSRGDMPFGATNPIYLDADGDGAFTPGRERPWE